MKEFIYPVHMEICVTAADRMFRQFTKIVEDTGILVRHQSPINVHNIIQTRSLILILCCMSNNIILFQNLTKTAYIIKDFELET